MLYAKIERVPRDCFELKLLRHARTGQVQSLSAAIALMEQRLGCSRPMPRELDDTLGEVWRSAH